MIEIAYFIENKIFKDKRGTFILMLNLQKKTYNIYKFRHFILTLAPK